MAAPARESLCEDDAIVGFDGGHALMRRINSATSARTIPFNVTLELTLNCNIRCLHCYNLDRDEPGGAACGSAHAPDARPELSLPEILSLMGDLRAAGCLFLGLTGGEVLTYPHLWAVMDRARELNLAVQLLTNGTMLRPGVAARLAGYRNLLGVSVSLYGATADVHDGVTQIGGSWKRTWEGVERMRAAGVAVRLKFIVMRPNAHQTAEVRAQADARGFPILIDVTVTPRHDGSRGSLGVRVTEEQLADLYRGPLRDMLPKKRARQLRDLRDRRRAAVHLGPVGGRQRPRPAVHRHLALLAGVPEDPRPARGGLRILRALPRQAVLRGQPRRGVQPFGQLHGRRPVRLPDRRDHARGDDVDGRNVRDVRIASSADSTPAKISGWRRSDFTRQTKCTTPSAAAT
jgi:MoaA/NifB/PqqE/SkfB family radical SAM enzyme